MNQWDDSGSLEWQFGKLGMEQPRDCSMSEESGASPGQLPRQPLKSPASGECWEDQQRRVPRRQEGQGVQIDYVGRRQSVFPQFLC